MPSGMTASAGIVATIACSALNAVAQSPTQPALPPLPPAAQSYGTEPTRSATAADANTTAPPSSGLNSRAANALRNGSGANPAAGTTNPPSNGFAPPSLLPPNLLTGNGPGSSLGNIPTTLPVASGANLGLPPALPNARAAAGPINPLRDQAAGLAAQAKMALDRGDAATARQLIDKANQLRVPDNEFGTGQLRPWQVAMDIDRVDRLRGNSGVVPASVNMPQGNLQQSNMPQGNMPQGNMPQGNMPQGIGPQGIMPPGNMPAGNMPPGNMPAGNFPAGNFPAGNMPRGPVQNATAQSLPPGLGPNQVQPSVYQPQNDLSRVAPASGVLSSYDPEETGSELYQQGITALSAGNKDAALRLFKSAWQKQADLDPGTRSQLKDKLNLLQVGGRNSGEPEGIAALSAEGRENQVKRQKWFAEVTGEIADAEKMAANNQPMEALDRLRVLRQRVSQADIDGAQRKNLLSMVDRVTNHMNAWAEENKPMIELDQRNKQIESSIALDAETLTKVNNQVQTLVEQYNDLIDKGRYAEAEAVARKVSEIKPNSEIANILYNKARIQRRVEEQEAIKLLKEDMFAAHFDSIEKAATPYDGETPLTMPNARTWMDISQKRLSKSTDLRMLPAEKKIRDALEEPFSASFDKRPLSEVMNTISEMTGITIVIDDRSIAEEGITVDQPISLDLRGNSILLKSVLRSMLERLDLTFTIKNEMLSIESSRFNKKEVKTIPYNVKDLVIPVPNFVSDYNTGMAGALQSAYQAQTHIASAKVNDQIGAGVATGRMASVDPNSEILTQMGSSMSPGAMIGSIPNSYSNSSSGLGGASMANYQELIGLIESTITPDQWQAQGGTSSMREFRQNLSLVVTAPQETHEAIADLLKSLRALQNLQVTIEVKFIQLSDTFFERIGLDFDFNIDDHVRPLPREDGRPSVAVGLSSGVGTGTAPQFTTDLDLQFRNNFGVNPPFGAPDAAAGTQVGLAILSDLELFFFLQAVQGNARTNVLNAPKVTMFDGQQASINDTASRPFVVSFDPVVGDFAVAQRPVIVVLNEGTQMNVQSVVSQDKRFVRMTLVPQFTRIESADRQFTFQGRRSSNTGTNLLNPNGTPRNLQDNQAEVIEGTTVQQPTLGTTSINTTVSVPDGGTILLGGIKRLREGRTERGTPILSKIPYLNRLFKNNAIGRETNTLMMTVTPRIIIPEEEEEAMGVPFRP